MHRRIRSTSSWPEILLIARYCRSKHILANRFSWYLLWQNTPNPSCYTFPVDSFGWYNTMAAINNTCSLYLRSILRSDRPDKSPVTTCNNWSPPGPPSDPPWHPGPAPWCFYCESLYCCLSRTTKPPPHPLLTPPSSPQAALPQSQIVTAQVCKRRGLLLLKTKTRE